MRVYLEATKGIYTVLDVDCNFIDRNGISNVFFKLTNGLTLIVDVPTSDYEKLIVPRLLKFGYYRIPEYFKYDFVK